MIPGRPVDPADGQRLCMAYAKRDAWKRHPVQCFKYRFRRL